MRKICFCVLLGLLFSCTSKDDDTVNDDLVVGWSNVVYQPELTRVVAVRNNNVLVRGSFPIDARSNFVYDQIFSVVQAKVPSVNFSNHVIIDVSMIDNVQNAEWPQLQQELKVFSLADNAIPSDWPPYKIGYTAKLLGQKVCGHPGRFHWWPIEGFNPSMPWEQKVGQFFTNNGYNNQPGGYNFNGLVDRLDSLLNDASYPKVIYYHCTWGKDRTGALPFGWLVKHGGYTKKAAISAVDSVFVPNDHYSGMISDYWTWLFNSL
jgi:hypothetical protein